MVDRLNILESATYRSREVAEVTGVTLRQLQWWDEQGLVSPMQTGHCRLYTGFEVQQVVLIKSLRNKGMSLRKIRPWLEQLSPRQVADALSLNRRGKDVYLLTDGERVYLEGTPERVIRRIGDSELPLTTMCISDLHCSLDQDRASRKSVRSAAHKGGKPAARSDSRSMAGARSLK